MHKFFDNSHKCFRINRNVARFLREQGKVQKIDLLPADEDMFPHEMGATDEEVIEWARTCARRNYD